MHERTTPRHVVLIQPKDYSIGSIFYRSSLYRYITIAVLLSYQSTCHFLSNTTNQLGTVE